MLREQFPITLQAFDLLQRDGENLERIAFWKRKEQLLELCVALKTDIIRFVPYRKDIRTAWKEVVAQNREGLILKQLDSAYVHVRSYSWQKLKNWRFEVCDVVGVTPGEGARSSFFGSLVLSSKGRFRGCVGSGFNDWELRYVKDTLTDASPMENPFPYAQVGEPYRAVKTSLQVLVKFYEITEAQVMRFPIFATSI